jgi:hypothetical protein
MDDALEGIVCILSESYPGILRNVLRQLKRELQDNLRPHRVKGRESQAHRF